MGGISQKAGVPARFQDLGTNKETCLANFSICLLLKLTEPAGSLQRHAANRLAFFIHRPPLQTSLAGLKSFAIQSTFAIPWTDPIHRRIVDMTPTAYPIPARATCNETVIKRSRFITALAHAPSSAVAREYVNALRQKYPTANHHCWAFVAGPPGESRVIGCSDDGEPHGTAGKPMLQVLLNCGVGEIVAVVTRYFGGTKLGKGGLVKAYTQGVQAALEALNVTEKRAWTALEVRCGYAQLDNLKHLCHQFDARITDTAFGEQVTVQIKVEAHQRKALKAALPR